MTTATATHKQAIKATLDTLRQYYAGKDGAPPALNATQIAVYLDGLAPFDPAQLEAAARQHMRASAFFPRLSDLLALLKPATDPQALAHLAWAQLERSARRIGAYRTVTFVDPAFGVAVRQVFGSWATVCSIDTGGPEWAIRRQTFLAVFAHLARRTDLEPAVTLGGLHRHDSEPAVIGHLEGLPVPQALAAEADRSGDVLAEVQRRAIAKTAQAATGATKSRDPHLTPSGRADRRATGRVRDSMAHLAAPTGATDDADR